MDRIFYRCREKSKRYLAEVTHCIVSISEQINYVYIEDITWPLGDTKFLFSCKKIFHTFAALTREIFFNTRRDISYLQAAM